MDYRKIRSKMTTIVNWFGAPGTGSCSLNADLLVRVLFIYESHDQAILTQPGKQQTGVVGLDAVSCACVNDREDRAHEWQGGWSMQSGEVKSGEISSSQI